MDQSEKKIVELRHELSQLQLAYNELKERFDTLNVIKNESFTSSFPSNSNFKDLLDDLMEGVLLIGFDGTFLYVNHAAAHQASLKPENIIGKKYSEILGGIDNSAIFKMYHKCMHERISLKFELSYSFENGVVKWFQQEIAPVKEGMIVLSLDITERKQVEDELKVKEHRYRLIAENARDVIWTMKLDGTITYISPAVELLRGFTVEEAMHQSIDQILTPESQIVVIDYLTRLNDAFYSGLPLPKYRGEQEYYCKDGSILWTEVIVYPLPENDSSSVTILGVTRDITERKQFEAKLLAQTKNLKDLNATKDKFFSIIAHDLRSPFNGILGFSEMLKNDVRDIDNESIKESVELINSSAKHTYNLLENLLNWARMQQGHLPFEPCKIFFNRLLKNEMESLSYAALQKQITLVNQTSQDLFIVADEQMLSTVLRNLLSNAIKFTPKYGIVTVEAQIKKEQFVFSIWDSGIGMDKEILQNLFKLETNTSTRGTANESGSGLGLLLCKEFIEKHSGEIRVESEPGKGTKFQFVIPINNTIFN